MPLETLRDLLGIARALYASWRGDGVGPIEMEQLRCIGEDLREAYRVATRSKPGTGVHRMAWGKTARPYRASITDHPEGAPPDYFIRPAKADARNIPAAQARLGQEMSAPDFNRAMGLAQVARMSRVE